MNKKQLLENFQHIYCRVGISKIHGIGVIAVQDIPAGINPFVGSFDKKYIEINDKEVMNLEDGVKEMINDYFFHENGKIYVPECGLNGLDISFFMNHSENPNVETKNGEKFVTLKKIKKGEELTFQYDINELNFIKEKS